VAHTGDYLVENPPPSNLDEPVGLVAAVCRTGEVIYAPDVRESPYYLQGNARTCSELVIPLRTAEHILGALDLQSEEYNAFTPHDQRILRAFADRVALAIDNMCYATDLEQRVAERTMEVLQAKNQAEAILNNSGDAIIVVTADNQIQQTNPTFDDLFGYEPCVLLEQSLFMLTTQGDAERLRDTIQTVIAANQSTRLEIVARRKNGTTFDADVAIAPIKEYADQQRRVVCSLRDITDRKQVEIELRKALERERELSELKSRFVSTTSHEFRTPLATMMTASELIRNYGHRMTEDQRMERLVSIQTQIKAMTQLLDDVLVVSREQEFRPEPLDIIGFCQRILDAVRLNDSTAHAFEFVWEGCEKTLIGDKALLARILNGLLNNAVKYSPPGSPVLLKLICEDKQTQIVVQDEGIGIPNEDQKRLFEVFHRAANVGVISGTGLGLSIVKQSAELHGGRVDFKSKIGLGSTFTVTIPNVLVEVTQ
jgi:PAS domain S-box-containing protein